MLLTTATPQSTIDSIFNNIFLSDSAQNNRNSLAQFCPSNQGISPLACHSFSPATRPWFSIIIYSCDIPVERLFLYVLGKSKCERWCFAHTHAWWHSFTVPSSKRLCASSSGNSVHHIMMVLLTIFSCSLDDAENQWLSESKAERIGRCSCEFQFQRRLKADGWVMLMSPEGAFMVLLQPEV